MRDEFPAAITHFIDQHIESIPQLEALLLLRRESQRHWTAGEVAKELYLPAAVANALLADLARGHLAELAVPAESRYVYQSPNTETDRLIDELAANYRDRRVAVVSLIYSKPLHKVQTFADAFRFGKEPPQ